MGAIAAFSFSGWRAPRSPTVVRQPIDANIIMTPWQRTTPSHAVINNVCRKNAGRVATTASDFLRNASHVRFRHDAARIVRSKCLARGKTATVLDQIRHRFSVFYRFDDEFSSGFFYFNAFITFFFKKEIQSISRLNIH